jgi:hypothetical protein
MSTATGTATPRTAPPLTLAASIARRWADITTSTARLDRVAAERSLRALALLGEVELPRRRILLDSPDAAASVARQQGLGQPWPAEWLLPREESPATDADADTWDDTWTALRFSGVEHPGFWQERVAEAPLAPTFAGNVHTFTAARLELARASGARVTTSGRVLLLAAEALHWVWVFDDAVIVCERPTSVRLDGSAELHADDSPALSYADGPDAFAWHGRVVPPWAILAPASLRLLHESDTAARRVAIENAGWPEVIRVLGMPSLGECVDPGNPGRRLRLHRMPHRLADDLYGRPANVLLMTNGSPARDGSLPSFAEVVPGELSSPLDAVAWQYGVEPTVYAQLARRT